ncbi:MAG: RraA family protein [Chloroflexota bacterium]
MNMSADYAATKEVPLQQDQAELAKMGVENRPDEKRLSAATTPLVQRVTDQTVEAFKRFSSAIVADVLRSMAYPQQVMDPTILPIKDGWKICGRAFTQSYLPTRFGEASLFAEAESHWKPGEVIVNGYWGSRGFVAALGAYVRGCAGMIIDGPYRDIPSHVAEIPSFPVFARRGQPDRSSNPGSGHRSFNTRWMHAYGVPVNCGGVRVEQGDIILGDDDGVVVIPKDIEDVTLKFVTFYDKVDECSAQAKREGKTPQEAYAEGSHAAKASGLLDWLKEDGRGFRAILESDYER